MATVGVPAHAQQRGGIVRSAPAGDKVSLAGVFRSDPMCSTAARATRWHDFWRGLDLIDNGNGNFNRPANTIWPGTQNCRKGSPGFRGRQRIIHLISDFPKERLAADEHDFALVSQVELQCTDLGSDQYSNLAIRGGRNIHVGSEGRRGRRWRTQDSDSPYSISGRRIRNGTRVTMSVDGRNPSLKRRCGYWLKAPCRGWSSDAARPYFRLCTTVALPADRRIRA